MAVDKAGRGTKLTPERQEKVVAAVRAGNYAKTACLISGIHESTYCAWKKRGKKALEEGREDIYSNFLLAIQEAHAVAEARNVAIINKAAQKDAKHAQWWLERTNWKMWGRKDTFRQQITGAGGGPIKITQVPTDLSDFSDEELAVLDRLGLQNSVSEKKVSENGNLRRNKD